MGYVYLFSENAFVSTLINVCLSCGVLARQLLWSRDLSYVQIPPDGPDPTLSLVGSGRVVSKFHYTDPTRPDPRTKSVHVEVERTSP